MNDGGGKVGGESAGVVVEDKTVLERDLKDGQTVSNAELCGRLT